MSGEWANTLYYGDNVHVLRDHIGDESVDLVYLDPPFKSNADYNVLFAEQNGTKAASQIKAFEDTWTWDSTTAAAFFEALKSGHGQVPAALTGLKSILGGSDMMAYLSMMAPRLIELHRVLAPTGSLYLHCDPTASHYLKLVLDAVFGPRQYRNEIIWKRTPFSGSSKARARQLPRCHDVILFYTKGDKWTWNAPTHPYSEEYLKRFKWDDEDGRGPYRKTLLKTYSEKTFQRLKRENRLVPPVKPGAKYSYKQYLSESSGHRQHDDIWVDINAINPVAQERLDYPTQKPEALLERIISASSNEGDVVLDPFCGCGTAIAVAQKFNRRWIGIDITHLAVGLVKHRLLDTFGIEEDRDYQVIGEPESISGAQQLAREDPFQFQAWALGLVGARVASSSNRGADNGIDGRLYFNDEGDVKTASVKRVILQVKSGKVNVKDVRDLVGTLDREDKSGAKIAALISLQGSTGPMRKEAASAGFYTSPGHTQHQRVQLLTIERLLEGTRLDIPMWHASRTFKKAPRAKKADQTQRSFFE